MEQYVPQVVLGIFTALTLIFCCGLIMYACRMKYLHDLKQEQEKRFFVDIRTIPNAVVVQTPTQVIVRGETIVRNPLNMV